MRRLAWAGALLLLCGQALAQTAREFVFDSTGVSPAPKKVSLAGSFNGWNRDATPMVADGTGSWRATVTLPDGIHFYKFVVDGETWITDPNSDKDIEESDGHGGVNSAVLIGPDARELPTVVAGVVEDKVLMHNPQSLRDANLTDSTLRLRLRLQAGSIDRATIWTQLPGSDPVKADDMQRVSSRLNIDEYVGQVEFASRPEKLSYWIELVDGAARRFVGPGSGSGMVALSDTPVAIQINQSTFTTPEWARDAVWYQIFPERFRNADPANDPGGMWYERRTRWNSPWYAALPGEATGDDNLYHGAGNVWKRRYGGDLAGVKEKLPYLRKLGINAIYFNPNDDFFIGIKAS
jgi:hypothetical protein